MDKTTPPKPKIPKATPEMKKFYFETLRENSKAVQQTGKLNKLIAQKKKEMETAIIGIGSALKIMQEELTRVQEEITEHSNPLEDTDVAFVKEFGIHYYDVDLYAKPNQEEVNKIKGGE